MKLARRNLLSAVAGAGAARLLPFVPNSVRAAEIGPPKRLLLVFHPMGYLENGFWPTRTPDGSDWNLGETQTALAPWKQKLIYLDGLLMYGASWYFPDDDNEHGSGAAMCFTGSKKSGFADGPSVEQPIADAIMAQNPRLPYRSLALGVRAPAPGGHTSVFVMPGKKPVNSDNSPRAVFDRIFKNFTPPAPGSTTVDTAALARIRAQKQSVLDFVRGDLNRLCTKVGAVEKERCDAHLSAIRAIENRLDQTTAPQTPTSCSKPTVSTTGDLVQDIQAQMDLITGAFTCDLTRVATLQLGFCDGGLSFLGLNQHDVTHKTGDTKGAPDMVSAHKSMDKWFASRWAYLLQRLDAVKETQGTLLDNTLVVFSSDTTTSSSYSWGAHQHWRFPYWMAGGGNFAFKTGRYLTYDHPARGDDSKTAKMWTPHNRLLTSVCRAFGLDVNSFGSMDWGTGPLAQL